MNQITVRWSLSAGVVGYGAALPDGRYAVLLNDTRIQTRDGLVSQPPGGPLMYLDLAPDGTLAGCGHNDDRVWKDDDNFWTDTEWAWGPYACVFRPDSSLVTFPDRAAWSETGGWRYSRPDGSLVPATNPPSASYADPARGLYGFTEWPDVAIGQGSKAINQGCVVRFTDDGILRRLAFKDLRATGELRFVVVKRAGDFFAIAVVDFQTASTTLTWATLAELRAMPPVVAVPPPVVIPKFNFTHPVILAPFAAGGSGLPDIFDLRADGRVLFIHDGEQDWTIPDLRPYDMALWELYLVPEETILQSAARWLRQSRSYLDQWPGDCGVVPMCYDQNRWTIGQILEALGYLSGIVNLSDRIKIIAPFEYNRLNGIIKYPELQAALGNLNTEAVRVGRSELTPIVVPPPTPPVPPKPPAPPVPPPAPAFVNIVAYEVSMSTEIVAIKGPGNKFGRIMQGDAGKGPFGWFPVRWDRDEPDDECKFELSKPDARYELKHVATGALLGIDATEFSDSIPKQFYGKPSDDRGAYESPFVGVVDGVIVGFVVYADKGFPSAAFGVVKL